MISWLRKYDDKLRKASGVSRDVWKAFKKRRRLLIRMTLLSMAFTFASLAVVGTQLFYPFHMVIGISLFVVSFMPFGYRVYLSRDTWKKYHSFGLVSSFVKRERLRLLAGVLVIIGVAVFLWLRPVGEHPFSGMSDQEIIQLVKDDLYRSVTAMDYLETTGNNVLVLLSDDRSGNNATEDVDRAFKEFLEAVSYSESLTETHRYFGSIPYSLWDERVTSFLISYSLYVKKYEIVHRMMSVVSNDEHKKKALNQYNEVFDEEAIYNDMVKLFYSPKTRIRLTAGYLYERFFIDDTPREDISFVLLRDKSYRSYEYLRSHIGQTLLYAPKVFFDGVEQKMFETWFPVQKGVATAMGRVILSTRGKEGLIQAEDALKMGKSMLPGDVMLQRRNWHVSNVGIPGFWTHSALYTGDLEMMDKYYASEFPYQGFDSMSEYMKAKLPLAYAAYSVESGSSSPSVIEAIEPGVVVQTLPKSANADFVVVLRPNLSKHDTFLALLKAFGNTGKPYDFNFDFDTRDAIVCSELVYDAYFERLPDKAGLHMTTSLVNGRKIVSPYDMAEKYVTERGTAEQEFKFVYFLKSNEKTKEVSVGSEKDLVDSLEWSKFSFLQE